MLRMAGIFLVERMKPQLFAYLVALLSEYTLERRQPAPANRCPHSSAITPCMHEKWQPHWCLVELAFTWVRPLATHLGCCRVSGEGKRGQSVGEAKLAAQEDALAEADNLVSQAHPNNKACTVATAPTHWC